jgi:hypothetical protein
MPPLAISEHDLRRLVAITASAIAEATPSRAAATSAPAQTAPVTSAATAMPAAAA